ncbi:MAG: heparan-alpha-glucosaminide N-acetyltransferase domain-containing protein [Acidobacteriota bacterium]|nr:heparan-alpha-glucosaminide N-acetyltransferase domain-containing protein [Acidobacteriota bacterium]
MAQSISPVKTAATPVITPDLLDSPATIGTQTIARDDMSTMARPRLDSIDLLRGLVMVLMALDHVRDFFHADAWAFDPTDLSKTNAALFLTRWVTHFCAPTFVFLAGTGAFLSFSRGKTKREVSWFLLTRGVWLIVLEMTLVRFGWFFNFDYTFMFAQVIWAIGWSLVVLAGLVFLPVRMVAIFGVMMILTHNLFDRVGTEDFGALGWLWTILHVSGILQPSGGVYMLIAYPLIPWIGVVAAGYGFGALLLKHPERRARRKLLLKIGVALTLAFVVLRFVNIYGDPVPWTPQSSAIFTFFSFINCMKYPPSLLFLLMTLGPAMVAIALFDREGRPGLLVRFFIIFGRVPLFYYLLHLLLIHGLAILFSYAQYGRAPWLFQNWPPPGAALPFPEGYGYGLPIVYLVWLLVVLLLFLPCYWFANLKRRRHDTWLSYF